MSTTPETTLKPCPFCGSEHINIDTHRAVCMNCACYVGPIGLDARSALEMWNTRAGSGEHSDQGGMDINQACWDFRESVLSGRHQLEEVLDNDQTNAVLGLFDDLVGQYLRTAPSSTDEAAQNH